MSEYVRSYNDTKEIWYISWYDMINGSMFLTEADCFKEDKVYKMETKAGNFEFRTLKACKEKLLELHQKAVKELGKV